MFYSVKVCRKLKCQSKYEHSIIPDKTLISWMKFRFILNYLHMEDMICLGKNLNYSTNTKFSLKELAYIGWYSHVNEFSCHVMYKNVL